MSLLHIIILAFVQGAAELLPVSSSAHVIVAAKLLGLDPTSPEMTLLLVMLHTGTMFAVIVYFWNSWKRGFFASARTRRESVRLIVVATAVTGVIGIALKTVIERVFLRHIPHAEIELLFGNLALIATALAAAGLLIIVAGVAARRSWGGKQVGVRESVWIGAIQGLCLPFRGFSRSGATISMGLLLGGARTRAEEFSFALAVVLTPPVVAREVMRLLKAHAAVSATGAGLAGHFYYSLLGMAASFIAGLLALRWLSSWLERGRWQLFGIYCLAASAGVFLLHRGGF